MVLKTIAQKAKENPGLTEAKIRWWVQNRHTNGMQESGVVTRIGGRIYIDDTAWTRWVETNKADRSVPNAQFIEA